MPVIYLSETMIFGQFAGYDAHAFLIARQLCPFETVGALKIQPFLLDPENSVWTAINENYVYASKHKLHG